MQKTLILYSTVDGQAKKIADYLKTQLTDKLASQQQSQQIDCMLFADFINQIDTSDGVGDFIAQQLNSYDNIIIGASIRYGKHRKDLIDFISSHSQLLNQKQTAFFSVNLVARKPEKNTATTNPYIAKFFEQITWQPNLVDVFAGKLDYALYGIFDKLMIKFIMWVTKGPTHSDVPIEFTDWQRVDTFVESVYQRFIKKS